MKKSYIIAIVFLALASTLVLYDRHAKQQREADSATNGRERLIPDLTEENITRFRFALATPPSAKSESTSSDTSTDTDDNSTTPPSAPSTPVVEPYSLVVEAERAHTDKQNNADSAEWRLKSPIEFPAKAETISQLLSAFLTYRYDEVFAAADNKLPQFGVFADKSTSLQVWTDSSEQKYKNYSYLVGHDSPVGFKMYLTTSFHPGHVYFGPRSSVMNQQRSLKDFMDMSVPSLDAFEAGDVLSLTSYTSAEDSKSAVIVFKETFTKKSGDDNDNQVNADKTPPSTGDHTTSIMLSQSPEKSHLVSQVVIANLIDHINEVSAVELAYAADDITKKTAIAQAHDKLLVAHSSQPEGSSSADAPTTTFEFSRLDNDYYIKKNGEYLKLSDNSLEPYFTMQINEFLVHPLPLAIAQPAIKTITLTSHLHAETDEGYQKSYQLKSGKWLTTTPPPTDSSSDTGDDDTGDMDDMDDMDDTLENLEELDLDKPEELSANITTFVADLYSSHYHIKTAKQPELSFELTYTLTIDSADKAENWEIYTTANNSDELWLKQLAETQGSPHYYLLKSELLDDLKEPYFDIEGTTTSVPVDSAATTQAEPSTAADPESALFNQNKAVNIKENLTPQLAPPEDTETTD